MLQQAKFKNQILFTFFMDVPHLVILFLNQVMIGYSITLFQGLMLYKNFVTILSKGANDDKMAK